MFRVRRHRFRGSLAKQEPLDLGKSTFVVREAADLDVEVDKAEMCALQQDVNDGQLSMEHRGAAMHRTMTLQKRSDEAGPSESSERKTGKRQLQTCVADL